MDWLDRVRHLGVMKMKRSVSGAALRTFPVASEQRLESRVFGDMSTHDPTLPESISAPNSFSISTSRRNAFS